MLDNTGQILHEGPLLNDRLALTALLTNYPAATVALEAGTHSPWISRYLTGLGATVIVANPRKLHAISRHERKCDRRDAVMLARLARADVALLHPIEHGTAQAQHDLLGLKLRDSLVRTRVNLINTVRFTLKSLGHAVSNPASEAFHKSILKVAIAVRAITRIDSGESTNAVEFLSRRIGDFYRTYAGLTHNDKRTKDWLVIVEQLANTNKVVADEIHRKIQQGNFAVSITAAILVERLNYD